MLDRELLKRDPSAGHKTRSCATTRLIPVHVPTPLPCLARSKGAKSPVGSWYPGNPR